MWPSKRSLLRWLLLLLLLPWLHLLLAHILLLLPQGPAAAAVFPAPCCAFHAIHCCCCAWARPPRRELSSSAAPSGPGLPRVIGSTRSRTRAPSPSDSPLVEDEQGATGTAMHINEAPRRGTYLFFRAALRYSAIVQTMTMFARSRTRKSRWLLGSSGSVLERTYSVGKRGDTLPRFSTSEQR